MGRTRKIVDRGMILDRALGLIEAEGLEAFSTRRLSASLGLSSMTLYNYYENTEAILKAIALRGLEEWHAGFSSLLDSMEEARGNPLRAFKALALELLRFGRDRPRLYLFLFDSSLADLRRDPQVSAWFSRLLDRCEAALADPGDGAALASDVYLFEVLANGLVVNCIRGRRDFDETLFLRLVDRAYARLLEPHEGRLRTEA
jgi:AcrR family transcriptional regulator